MVPDGHLLVDHNAHELHRPLRGTGSLKPAGMRSRSAARSRGGIHELIDIETVRAVAHTVADLHDDLEAGGGVHGELVQPPAVLASYRVIDVSRNLPSTK